MLGAHSKLSQPLIELWELGLPSWMIAHVGVGFSYGDGFGWMWGVNEVERDRFGGLCDLAGKLVEDVQYFNFQVWVWGFVRIGPPSDEDSTDKDGDIGVLVSLGDEIFSEGKKSQESNIGDSDNIRNGGKTASRAIITWGGGIAS
ncbi:hypothetical protein Tco_1475465 [Tanacetum coccineum]